MGDGFYRGKYLKKERELKLLILAIHESGENVQKRVAASMQNIIKRNTK